MSPTAAMDIRMCISSSGARTASGWDVSVRKTCRITMTGGVTSTAVVYNAERNVFEIRYLMKNSQEPGVVESQGLERVEFTPYGVQEK